MTTNRHASLRKTSLRSLPSGARCKPRIDLSIIVITGFLLLAPVPQAIPAQSAVAPDQTRQSQLRHLVMNNCSACHGPKLTGKLGPALTPDALSEKDTTFLTRTVLNGRTGTPMPAWDFMVNKDEARWLVEQLKQGAIQAE